MITYAIFDISQETYNEYESIVVFRGDFEPIVVLKSDVTIVIESDDGDYLRVEVPVAYFHRNRRNPCQYAGYVGNYTY